MITGASSSLGIGSTRASTGRRGREVGDEVSSCIWAGDSFKMRSLSESPRGELGEVTLLFRLLCSDLASGPGSLVSLAPSSDMEPWRCVLPLLSTPLVSCFFSSACAMPFDAAPSGAVEMPRPGGAPSSAAERSGGLGERAGVGSRWAVSGESGGNVSAALSGSCRPFIALQCRGQSDQHASPRRGRTKGRRSWRVL